jgi:pimeloyl-ACP methyl ester carboxylesterase
MSNVAADSGDIRGVVYVCGFAPDQGESAFELSEKFPGSMAGDAVRPTPLSNGTTNLGIAQDLYHERFCPDVPAKTAGQMAVTQRPATLEALQEPSGQPLWKQVPSWFIYGEKDLIIPAAVHSFMAERAGARKTVEIEGASHALSVSHPVETAQMILEASAAIESSTDGSAPADPKSLSPVSH